MTSSSKKQEDYPLALRTRDIAEIMGVSMDTAYCAIHQKGFPVIKITERKFIIPRDAFFNWFNSAGK